MRGGGPLVPPATSKCAAKGRRSAADARPSCKASHARRRDVTHREGTPSEKRADGEVYALDQFPSRDDIDLLERHGKRHRTVQSIDEHDVAVICARGQIE